MLNFSKILRLWFCVLFLVAILFYPAAGEVKTDFFRIGLIGLDTSHVIAFTRTINDPKKALKERLQRHRRGGRIDPSGCAALRPDDVREPAVRTSVIAQDRTDCPVGGPARSEQPAADAGKETVVEAGRPARLFRPPAGRPSAGVEEASKAGQEVRRRLLAPHG